MVASIPIVYKQSSNRPISPIDDTLTGSTTPCPSGFWSNANESQLHTPLISRTETSPSNAI